VTADLLGRALQAHGGFGRVAIEKLDGQLVAERREPRASFAGHKLRTPWDPLHRAYFSS
jgi:hypothetical protein